MSEPLTSELAAWDENVTGQLTAPSDARTRQREHLHQMLRQHPPCEISPAEVEAHFQTMPARYWDRLTKTELVWALETVHAFLLKLAAPDFVASAVAADSRHCPERGFTKVMVCAWDRPGLLRKITAAFTALRVNILRADAFTRTDNLVLDVFEVCDLEHRHIAAPAHLQHLVFLVEGALSDPPRFASVWAGQSHKTVPRPAGATPLLIEFDNDFSGDYTVLRVEAADRLGLLHDILQALTGCSVNIAQAVVETGNSTARDLLYITDFEAKKILDPSRLETIRKALRRAIRLEPPLSPAPP